MTNSMTTIWQRVLYILRDSVSRIFTTHLVYVALGTLLIRPLVGLVGRSPLHLSGQSAISDFDIAYFLLTPLGMTALILLTALLITILVFEQASLMAICAGSVQGLHISTMSAVYFTARQAKMIFSLSNRPVRIGCMPCTGLPWHWGYGWPECE